MNPIASAYNKITAPAHNISVTGDTLLYAQAHLPQKVKGQDQAISVLLQWLTKMSKESSKKMLGSLCLAGKAAPMEESIAQLSEAIWSCRKKTQHIDMSQYSTADSCSEFLAALKAAHGNTVIVFWDLYLAHETAVSIVRHFVQFRAIGRYSSPSRFNVYLGKLDCFNFFLDKLDFSNVLFICTHTPTVFSKIQLTPVQIVERTRKVLGDSLFDEIVPFVMGERSGPSGRPTFVPRDIFAEPQQIHPRLSNTKRAEPEQEDVQQEDAQQGEASKKRKTDTHPIAVTSRSNNNNNNTTTSTTTTASNNATKSNNTPTNSHNPTDSHNPITGDKNTTNSYNNTSALPVTVSNTSSKHSQPTLRELQDSNQPFQSHKNVAVDLFIDGDNYFSRLHNVLELAQKEILICGWQLSNIYLKRPITPTLPKVFDLLNAASRRGVVVNVLLRNYDGYFIVNDHNTVKATLETEENISVTLQHNGWTGSHHQKFVVVDRRIGFVGGLDITCGRYDVSTHPITDEDGTMFPGADYQNAGVENICNLTHPRMGWHDVQVSVEGAGIVYDLRRAFWERWNVSNPKSLMYDLECFPSNPLESAVRNCEVQVIRTIPKGVLPYKRYREKSILETYCDLIENAETFVYIENQYFLEADEEKRFSRTIGRRIRRAHEDKKPFIVAVVLPILPDNGGVYDTKVQTILNSQRETIAWINDYLDDLQIYAPLYIRYYGLLKCANMNGKKVAAQIYVHSKVMITDDSAVVGSCNINHRSTSGKGDTEIGVVVKDKTFANQFIRSLLDEHVGQPCGIEEKAIFNFITGPMNKTALLNMDAYDLVFQTWKSTTAKEYDQKKPVGREDVQNNLQGIQGHIVTLPMELLQNETQSHIWQVAMSPIIRSLTK